MVACVVWLAGCVGGLDPDVANRGSILEGGVFGDLRARKPAGNANTAKGLIPVGNQVGSTEVYGPGGYADDGSAISGTAASGAVTNATAGSFRLNFENADLKDVIHAVMADALQLNYTLSPDVAGTVTISSTSPVGRKELLATLETILTSQGFSLNKSGSLYKIGPATGGGGQVDFGATAQPGYGISVLPLRYVSVKTMTQLLGGFVTDAEGLRIDTTRNALIISGGGAKREEVIQTALSFDADWMANQSVAIFQLRQSAAETIVGELEKVFDSGANGAANGAIQFQAIKRLKSVLAVSKNPALIARAQTWVQRLDRENSATGDNIFVYRARYRDAKDLAKILSSLFGASTSTAGSAGTTTAAPTPSLSNSDGSGDGLPGGDGGTGAGGNGDSGNANQNGGVDPAQAEPPIDDVTGASSAGAPDVIDLTTQSGGSGSGSSIRVSADLSNNSVITYTDPMTYEKILVTLKELDRAPLQVEINATIAEVQLTDELKYGVQYFLKSSTLGLEPDTGSGGFQTSAGALASQIPGFNLLLGAAKNPQLIISALDTVTDVEVLSSPSLVVMENQTASLQVGDDVPIAVTQQQSTDANGRIINQIQYRNTGIILKVTPRIGENGAVTMQIQQEISAVRNGTGGTLNPTFSKRSINSQISVVSGQTVVLAGLITSEKSNNNAGLPLISRIPGLKDVAGSTGKKGARSELVVLIKPNVIYDGEDAQTVAEDLRSRMWAIGARERPSP